MKNKRITLVVFIVGFAVVVLAGAFYFLNQHFKFFADQPIVNINNQIVISKIALFSDGSNKVPIEDIELLTPEGESQSFELLVENNSSQSYQNFTITKSDLSSASGEVISGSAIDERIVHPWPQKLVDWSSSGNTFTPSAVSVDELLVKNDKPDLTLPTDPKYAGDTFFSDDIGVDEKQLLQGSGYALAETGEGIKTAVVANSSKKFYFTVNIPANKTGVYSGEINFVDKDSNTIVAKFVLKLKIYDFAFQSQDKQSLGLFDGCYTNDRILAFGASPSDSIKHYFISSNLFKTRLSTLKDYGCNFLVMRVGEYADNQAMIKAVSDSGMAGPLILNFYGVDTSGNQNIHDTVADPTSAAKFSEILTQIKNLTSLKIPIIFYGIDEPNTDALLAEHLAKVDNIKKLVGQVFGADLANSTVKNQVTTLAKVSTWEKIFSILTADNKYRTDYPIENYSTDEFLTDKVAPINNGLTKPLLGESFYFQGWNEIQKSNGTFLPINRYLAGLGLYKSGLKGSFINPAYGYRGVNYRPIYDDYAVPGAADDWQKPMFTFYPASDGFIPTLQAESWREGTEDLKYFAAYKSISESGLSNISEAKKAKLADFANVINSNLEQYNFNVNNYTLPADLDSEKMNQTKSLLNQYLEAYVAPEVPADTTPPTIEDVNLSDNQIITTNPYIITAKVTDNIGVDKVEFYVDGDLIGTSTLPDVSGVYEVPWDTSKYHSEVKVVAYDTSNNKSEVGKATTVDLSGSGGDQIVNVLPKTGEESWLNRIFQKLKNIRGLLLQ